LIDAGVDSSTVEIVFQNAGSYGEVCRRSLRPWLSALLEEIAPREGSLGVRFCGSRAMRRTNRDFRGRDSVTDVLSFPGSDGPPGEAHLGDILICVPRARQQAAERAHSVQRELGLLLLHGVLHCLGYDHESDDGEMERLERTLRREWLPRI
jgi:probable rRNA maturation factor